MTSDFIDVLRENLEVAARMHHHLERSRQQSADDVPLLAEQISQLDDAQIDRLDLYLARFSKLQDFITSKLFRSAALASLEDTSQDVSLIDALRRMEKYDIVHDFDDWLGIRLLRNSLTHECLTDEAAIAENINTAFSAYEILSATLARVRRYYEMHIIKGRKRVVPLNNPQRKLPPSSRPRPLPSGAQAPGQAAAGVQGNHPVIPA